MSGDAAILVGLALAVAVLLFDARRRDRALRLRHDVNRVEIAATRRAAEGAEAAATRSEDVARVTGAEVRRWNSEMDRLNTKLAKRGSMPSIPDGGREG